MSRNNIKTFMLSALAFVAVGCNFEEINIDPNKTTEIKPGPLLTYTQMNTSVDGHTKNMQIGTCMMLVQQTATLNTTEAGLGDKYYMMDAAANQYFLDFYSTAIKNWRELETIVNADPEYVKMQGVAKIWGAYLFQRMTDLYGDVPYTEAGQGYHEQIFKPKYDAQKDIYMDMIEQVKAGIQLLDQEGLPIEGDLFYDGNVEQWKKFGNSLLLHLGMRLCKVDPALAQQTAAAAIKGGIMSSAKDMARIVHYDGGRDDVKNQVALRFYKDNYIANDAVKISKTFMDYLKATNDPRIGVLCSLKNGDADPAKQLGLPNGYDNNNSATIPGWAGKDSYSNFNTKYILKMDAPTILMTASETKLLEAEAILRGWASGDADKVFKEAVTISMKEQEYAYGAKIPDAQINAFLAQDLFKNASSKEAKMEVLGNQYWVATFMNGYESFANWRRCGYPKLTPTNYKGNQSNGTIPRRLPYSTDEYSINKANIDAAIARQGEDKVYTRIWWDVK